MDIKKYLSDKKKVIDEALNKYLPAENEYPQIIHEAMRYSAFAGEASGGKRLRPILALAAAETIGKNDLEHLLPAAIALELIHTYSLIHDDLPALDNDDYRRGVPTSHKKYGEAIAVLAGDALLTHAFYLVFISKARPELVQKAGQEIAFAVSTFGMIGGQVVDLLSEGKSPDAPTLQYIHTHKTGALITACLRIGCILGQSSEAQLKALTQYGEHVGLAFQIVDDLLDVEQVAGKGKKRMSDRDRKKLTYPEVYGINESKEHVQVLIEGALAALKNFGPEAEALRTIAKFIGQRQY